MIGDFLDFNMIDSRIVMSQVQEFQITLHDIYAKNMIINGSF
jgi:hypothetical protein